MPTEAVREATYHFDPACPWTWRTSRWLVDVAARHDVTIRWRAFDLSGGAAYLPALDDDAGDAGVPAARAAAIALAGDDAGSPVLVLTTDAGERGFFGPVLAPTPTGDAADRLWDAVVGAAGVAGFFELKSRRNAQP